MNNRAKFNIKKLICITAVTVFFAVCFQINIINSAAESAVPVKSDAAVILGYRLDDNDKPAGFLEERLITGLQIYNDDMCDYIVVTGKQGPNDNLPVAEAMKDWLVEKGVDPDKIIVENKAGNTYENFKYTSELITPDSSIIIVTNKFHIYRSEIIAGKFFKNISSAAADNDKGFEELINYIKEPFSLLKYYAFSLQDDTGFK